MAEGSLRVEIESRISAMELKGYNFNVILYRDEE